ncbi:MAG: RNA polymerase factor sigma-54 [Lachnospiraceae bacterium]|nr:RNA polymerase factor sigma-54 [Lachnospiraceae bacterium]
MRMTHEVTVEDKQVLSQAQIQSLEILAMDVVELEEFLQNEYMSNPMMDHTANHDMNSEMEKFQNSYDGQYAGRDYVEARDEDEKERGGLKAPDTNYLKNYLVSQLDMKRFSKEEWKLVLYLIDCLEDDGFFQMETAEVAELTGQSLEKVEEVLQMLRNLEPFGIFARDLSHCLLRQLEAIGADTPALSAMVLEYLPEIGQGKISVISRQLGLSTAEVRKYIAVIEKLNPRPLSGLQESQVSYIVPDIIYTEKNGRWEITINDKWLGEYHINDYYLHMMKETKDPELFEYFKQKLERSRFVISSIEQRRETMYAVSKGILDKQKDYFCRKGKRKPMTMSALAEELQIHPSTVSRTVKGKYIQSPAGTILMKNLFSGTVSADENGEELSAEHIKERIRELINSEDKRNPYSDAKLTECLVAEGIQISRRAVAKYRDELWIKSSFERKVR